MRVRDELKRIANLLDGSAAAIEDLTHAERLTLGAETAHTTERMRQMIKQLREITTELRLLEIDEQG